MGVMAIFATIPNYRLVAPAILTAVLWGMYLLRGRLNLSPLRYALFCGALLLHMLGAFGFYQRSPLPFSYDILVHSFFGVVLTLTFYHALRGIYPALHPWQLSIITFFFVMGSGALHEIMEYGTYLVLGEERGMLKPTTSYFFDTQRDLTNNLLGALTTLTAIALARRMRVPDRNPA